MTAAERITRAQLNVLRSIDRRGPLVGTREGRTIRYGRRWNIILACERRGWIVFTDANVWDLTDAGRAKLTEWPDERLRAERRVID